MSKISLILLAAGDSRRFAMPVKKQWLYQRDIPLWLHVAQAFEEIGEFQDIIITGHSDELEYMRRFADYSFIPGGASRQESLRNALAQVRSSWVLVSDIARCCLDREMIKRVLSHCEEADCIVPSLSAVDTVYEDNHPVNRERIRLIQTPQLSRSALLKEALEQKEEFSDESSAIHAIGGKILHVEGSVRARKLTYPQDLKYLECLKAPATQIFTGYGIDIHAFEDGKQMVLGGVFIDSPMGFKAHSDGDVAIHALIDALLGAAGMGDIGEHFPDSDPRWKDVQSTKLLKQVLEKIQGCGLVPLHADLTIIAQAPRLVPYKEQIRRRLAQMLALPPARVNVKATTAENMGFIGRKEGVAVQAVATLGIYDWSRKI